MTQTQGGPHILVAVDASLTREVWRRFDERPIILGVDPFTLLRGDPASGPLWRAPWANPERIYPVSLETLAGHLSHERPPVVAFDPVEEAISHARQDFGLPEEEPVVTAVVGNESRLRAILDLGEAQGRFDEFLIREKVRAGKVASRLGEVLENFPGLELQWLALIDREVAPAGNPDAEHIRLAVEVRNRLGELEPVHSAGGPTHLLRVPASPGIYIREGKARWRLLPPDQQTAEEEREFRSATSWLIETFRRFRQASSFTWRVPRGILVDVLADDLSKHSPADPPFITPGDRKAARAAGLEAILLDGRVGVNACAANEEDARTMRVCAV